MALSKNKVKKLVRRHLLMLLTALGVVAGLLLGFMLSASSSQVRWSKRQVMYVQFLGDLYLRMLNCLILPLVVSAVISAVGCLDLRTSWRIGLRTLLWFVSTEYLAVVTGIILVVAIQPGSGRSVDGQEALEGAGHMLVVDTVLDIFRNLFPPNLVECSLVQYRTVLTPPENESVPLEDWHISHEHHDGFNIIGLVMFSMFVGLAVGMMDESGRSVIDFFRTLERSMMTAVNWVLWLSPVGVMSLLTAKLLESQNWSSLLERLGLYFMTVLIGLFIHALVVVPVLYFLTTRKNPFKFLGNMSQALLMAFGTASSGATLPVTMDCLEERNKLDERIVRFTVPIGTLSMDGTALYEAVAVIFLAQVREFPLGFGQLVVISITVTAACLGGSAVPQAGLMMMVMILTSLGLPPQDVAIIVAVDWLLDRFRTTVNVIGDAFGAGVVEHFSKDELERLKYVAVQQEDLEMTDNFTIG